MHLARFECRCIQTWLRPTRFAFLRRRSVRDNQPVVTQPRTGARVERIEQPPVIVEGLDRLKLDESQPVIYDRPIGLRLLYEDPTSGAEHYLVRYPPGLQARWHRHTAAHTIVVLDGALSVNGRRVGPGSYCHFPAGQAMHHAPADDDPCLFVIIFDGPFDVHPLDDEPDVAHRDT